MDQRGFVEIALVKGDQLYRASLPMGVPWADVHVALTELCDMVAAHIVEVNKVVAEQEAAKLAEEAAKLAEPIEVTPVEEAPVEVAPVE